MTIKQALSILKNRLQTGENLGENEKPQSDYDEFVNEQYTALKIVIEEFENKSLTLEQLKNMIGKPVYSNHSCCYRVIKNVSCEDGQIFFTDLQDKWWETFEENRFYKYKNEK